MKRGVVGYVIIIYNIYIINFSSALSRSLSLSLSLCVSVSLSVNSIQNCFIGMTVNYTIWPKLSMHVQKDKIIKIK